METAINLFALTWRIFHPNRCNTRTGGSLPHIAQARCEGCQNKVLTEGVIHRTPFHFYAENRIGMSGGKLSRFVWIFLFAYGILYPTGRYSRIYLPVYLF